MRPPSGPRSPWYKLVISLGISLYVIYIPRAGGPRTFIVCWPGYVIQDPNRVLHIQLVSWHVRGVMLLLILYIELLALGFR